MTALLTKREYFAAHAPDVPAMFLFKKVLAIVDAGGGQKREEWQPEPDLARIVRWRLHYADQMLAALGEGGVS